MKDIRFFPWKIEPFNSDKLARVYYYKGFKVALTRVTKIGGGHAEVCEYSVLTPQNKLIENIDLAEVNKILNI